MDGLRLQLVRVEGDRSISYNDFNDWDCLDVACAWFKWWAHCSHASADVCADDGRGIIMPLRRWHEVLVKSSKWLLTTVHCARPTSHLLALHSLDNSTSSRPIERLYQWVGYDYCLKAIDCKPLFRRLQKVVAFLQWQCTTYFGIYYNHLFQLFASIWCWCSRNECYLLLYALQTVSSLIS